MNSSRILLCFALILALTAAESYNRCYKCASLHVILNWNRYFGVISEMDSVAEESCMNDTAVHNYISCKGPCLTLNITGTMKDGSPYVAGVLRGCETNFWRKTHEVEEGKETSVFRHKHYNSREYTAQYCFCRGDHCNGPKPESHEFKSARLRKRPYGRGAANANSLQVIFISTVMYIANML